MLILSGLSSENTPPAVRGRPNSQKLDNLRQVAPDANLQRCPSGRYTAAFAENLFLLAGDASAVSLQFPDLKEGCHTDCNRECLKSAEVV